MKLVGMAKRTGHLVVVIPLHEIVEEYLERPMAQYKISLFDTAQKPIAYAIDIGDKSEVHGPIVLKYIEILGEL